MRRHRWGWRIAAISPAVIILGLAGTALAAGGSGSNCPGQGGLIGSVTGTVCQTVNSVTKPGGILPTALPSILPSPVASIVGTAGSTVGGTVNNTVNAVTGSSSSSSGSSGSGSGSSGGSSGHGQASGPGRHSQASASALGAAGAGAASAGVLSSLGVPGWLVRGGLGPLPGATVPLSFPVVRPGSKTVAQEFRAAQATRSVSSLWLVFAVGVACLVGVAGGLGRFEGR